MLNNWRRPREQFRVPFLQVQPEASACGSDNVSVEDDFPKTLIALKNLKSLKGLQLEVPKNGNNDLIEGYRNVVETRMDPLVWRQSGHPNVV